MDILAVMEQFGVPVAMTIAFGFFIWRQNKFIQETLMNELDQDFKRLEGIIVKLIDQQKKVQMEQQRLNGVFRAMVEIIARLSGNGLKDKFMRMMEKNND
jgi:lambda repressor-like predicted transcriptional regulator|tara:strand:+ start:118 stop:417 length:300 start_codon:yes stop_codon:yes gene_type:complete